MSNPICETQVLRVVTQTLAEVLGRDVAEVTPESALVNDLGADSLDFVELMYSLERKLNVALPKRSIIDHATTISGDGRLFFNDSGLTDLGVFLLKNSFFRFNAAQIRLGMSQPEVMSAATVANWANLCHQLFAYLPKLCPDCGREGPYSNTDCKVVCGHCHATLKPTPGDEILANYVPAVLQAWEASEAR